MLIISPIKFKSATILSTRDATAAVSLAKVQALNAAIFSNNLITEQRLLIRFNWQQYGSTPNVWQQGAFNGIPTFAARAVARRESRS